MNCDLSTFPLTHTQAFPSASSVAATSPRGQARRDPPINRNPPSLPMLSTLLLLPMLRIDAKLPMLSSDAALAIDSRLEALIRLHQLR